MASQDDPIKGGVEGLTRGISSALAMRQNKAQVANIEANTAKTLAEANQLRLESAARGAWWEKRPGELEQRIGLMGHQASIASATARFLEDTMQSRVSIAGLEREELEEILNQLRQEIELRGLDRAPLEAQEKFAKTWFGSNVAPAMGSASGVAGVMSAIVAPFLRYMEERGRSERGNRTQSSPSRRRRP